MQICYKVMKMNISIFKVDTNYPKFLVFFYTKKITCFDKVMSFDCSVSADVFRRWSQEYC